MCTGLKVVAYLIDRSSLWLAGLKFRYFRNWSTVDNISISCWPNFSLMGGGIVLPHIWRCPYVTNLSVAINQNLVKFWLCSHMIFFILLNLLIMDLRASHLPCMVCTFPLTILTYRPTYFEFWNVGSSAEVSVQSNFNPLKLILEISCSVNGSQKSSVFHGAHIIERILTVRASIKGGKGGERIFCPSKKKVKSPHFHFHKNINCHYLGFLFKKGRLL